MSKAHQPSSAAYSNFAGSDERHAAVLPDKDKHKLRCPYTTQNTLLKAEGMRSIIKCKTTDVMADFMPLWKVKQSAL